MRRGGKGGDEGKGSVGKVRVKMKGRGKEEERRGEGKGMREQRGKQVIAETSWPS